MKKSFAHTRLATLVLIFVLVLSSYSLALIPRYPFDNYVYDHEQEARVSVATPNMRATVTALFCIRPELNEELIITYSEEGLMAYAEKFAEFRRLNVCTWNRATSLRLHKYGEIEMILRPGEFNDIRTEIVVEIAIVYGSASRSGNQSSSRTGEMLYFAIPSNQWEE